MKKTRILDQDLLLQKAAEILMRELGPVEAARFFALMPEKQSDAVARHRNWQKKLNSKEYLDLVF